MTHANSGDSAPAALTIAGSDPSGGAGLQADLKAFSSLGIFGMTAVTALTIGNTTGVYDMIKIDPATVCRQVRAVIEDIPPQSIKTGLMGTKEVIINVAQELEEHTSCPLIVDPVIATKRGDVLASDEEVSAYQSYLLPQAEVVTPNIPEAELLARMQISSPDAMPEAAKQIIDLGCNSVVIKGGYFDEWEQSNDLFYDGETMNWLNSLRIHSKHTHGSGDVFSAAVTAHIIKDKNLL
ncbi:bifunctional hydroxymethylpyrimidine kinase/phosphomethylpyrimidine kinase [Fodinibius salsisoli]|uniref:hydroxymethylpyrimidine kinase n=1 Tax=Fodinibius salsisoli TaxID=2820877 RepID=A0ABT3PII5_9BACT|nr:bifunctional hydroxymethylpyrimidine kinase/phosphomethylpyrimidine kinase [Fodinibius salsisoli]MCW9705731.1 bifunctional hydroxymethylpyrimidine kinase/phosphomethylpyrimidine kinase [Fodinibius salsisoli]